MPVPTREDFEIPAHEDAYRLQQRQEQLTQQLEVDGEHVERVIRNLHAEEISPLIKTSPGDPRRFHPWANANEMFERLGGLPWRAAMPRLEAEEQRELGLTGNRRALELTWAAGLDPNGPYTPAIRRHFWFQELVERSEPMDVEVERYQNEIADATWGLYFGDLQNPPAVEQGVYGLAPEGRTLLLRKILDPTFELPEGLEPLYAGWKSWRQQAIRGRQDPELILARNYHAAARGTVRQARLSAFGMAPEPLLGAMPANFKELLTDQVNPIDAGVISPVLALIGDALPSPPQSPGADPMTKLQYHMAQRKQQMLESSRVTEDLDKAVAQVGLKALFAPVGLAIEVLGEGVAQLDDATSLHALPYFTDVVDSIQKQGLKQLLEAWTIPEGTERTATTDPFMQAAEDPEFGTLRPSENDIRGMFTLNKFAAEGGDIEKLPGLQQIARQGLDRLEEIENTPLTEADARELRSTVLSWPAMINDVWAISATPQTQEGRDQYFRENWLMREVLGAFKVGPDMVGGVLGVLEGDKATAGFGALLALGAAGKRSAKLRGAMADLRELGRIRSSAKDMAKALERLPKHDQVKTLSGFSKRLKGIVEANKRDPRANGVQRAIHRELANRASALEIMAEEFELHNTAPARWRTRAAFARTKQLLGRHFLQTLDPTGFWTEQFLKAPKAVGLTRAQYAPEAGDVRRNQAVATQRLVDGILHDTGPGPKPKLFEMQGAYIERLAEAEAYQVSMGNLFRSRIRAEGRILTEIQKHLTATEGMLSSVTGAAETTSPWVKRLRGRQTKVLKASIKEMKGEVKAHETAVRNLGDWYRRFLDPELTDLVGKGYEIPREVSEALFDRTAIEVLAHGDARMRLALEAARGTEGKAFMEKFRDAAKLEGPVGDLGPAILDARAFVAMRARQVESGSAELLEPPDTDPFSNAHRLRRSRIYGDIARHAATRGAAYEMNYERIAFVAARIREAGTPESAALASALTRAAKSRGTGAAAKGRVFDLLIEAEYGNLKGKPETIAARDILTSLYEHGTTMMGKSVVYDQMGAAAVAEAERRYQPHHARAPERSALLAEALGEGKTGTAKPRAGIQAGAAAIDRKPFVAQREFGKWRVIREGRASKYFDTKKAADTWAEQVYGTKDWEALGAKHKVHRLAPLTETDVAAMDFNPDALSAYFHNLKAFQDSVLKAEFLEHAKVPGAWIPREEIPNLSELEQELLRKGTSRMVQIPDSPEFGPLAGGAVHRDMLRAISQASEYAGYLSGIEKAIRGQLDIQTPLAYRLGQGKAAQAVRTATLSSWILYNTQPWANNVVFNVKTAMYAGAPPHAVATPTFWEGVKMWRERHPRMLEAQKAGLDLQHSPITGRKVGKRYTDALDQLMGKPDIKNMKELGRRLETLDALLDPEAPRPSQFAELTGERAMIRQQLKDLNGQQTGRAIKELGMALPKAGWWANASLFDLYSTIDPAMKAGYLWYLMKHDKVPLTDAVARLRTHMQDYSNIGYGWRRLGKNPMFPELVNFQHEYIRTKWNHMTKAFPTWAMVHGAQLTWNQAQLARAGYTLEDYGTQLGAFDAYDLYREMASRTILYADKSGIVDLDNRSWSGASITQTPMGDLRRAAKSLQRSKSLPDKLAGTVLATVSHMVGSSIPLMLLDSARGFDQWTGQAEWSPEQTTGEKVQAMAKGVARRFVPAVRNYEQLFGGGKVDMHRARRTTNWEEAGGLFGLRYMRKEDAVHRILAESHRHSGSISGWVGMLENRWTEVGEYLSEIGVDRKLDESEFAEVREILAKLPVAKTYTADEVWNRNADDVYRAFLRLAGFGPVDDFVRMPLEQKAWVMTHLVRHGLDKETPELFKAFADYAEEGNYILTYPSDPDKVGYRDGLTQIRKQALRESDAEFPSRGFRSVSDRDQLQGALDVLEALGEGVNPDIDNWLYWTRRRLRDLGPSPREEKATRGARMEKVLRAIRR